jgi:hypothetical protein
VRAAALVLTVAVAAGCATGRPPQAPAPTCGPAPDPGAIHRQALVFLDGKRVGGPVAVALVQAEPETFDFEGDLPAPVRDLAPGRIDLIQFVSGEAAERDYGACPGVVVALITTKGG